MKKAQITFIIIIGIVLLIAAALLFYVSNYLSKNARTPLAFDKASIENYVNACIKKTGEDGLNLLGKQGGLIALKEHLKVPQWGISYSLYANENKVPSIERMQEELSFYMKSNLNNCLKDLKDFKRQGWNVEKNSFNTKTRINEKDVLFEVDFPFTVSKPDNSISFERFASSIEVRLSYIKNLADKIVNLNLKYPKSVDRTDLANYNVNVTVFPYENSLVYVVCDEESSIMKQPYRFMFALKFQ